MAPDFPGTVPDRLLPHSVESEEALLGSILVNVDTLILCQEQGLKSEHFFVHRNGWIYEAMLHLGPACELIALADELARRGQLAEIGGASHLMELSGQIFRHSNAPTYAQTIKELAIRRGLIAKAGDIARLAYDPGELSSAELLQASAEMVLQVALDNPLNRSHPTEFFTERYLAELDAYYASGNALQGIPTSLLDLNKLLSGLQRAKLILVAGRPAMGKSALVLQMSRHATQKHRARVLYFSLEMIGDELIERMACGMTGLSNSKDIRVPNPAEETISRINQATAEIDRWPLLINDSSFSLEEIATEIIVQKFRTGLDLAVIDYLQRITTVKDFRNRDAELGYISSTLKRLANMLRIPIVAVSSLSRKVEERRDKHPQLSDLRESGNLEYDADVVIFLYCDDQYNPDTEFPGMADVDVAKNRGGPTGRFSAFFRRPQSQFVEIEVWRQPILY